ncbi:MAG: arcadin 1 [Candidatus Bathyarchaeia archaeon]
MRVRVNRIESYRDLNGNLGKRIELVQEETTPRFITRPESAEAKMIQDILRVMQQQMPLLNIQTQITMPKIILFLTEREYEELGVNFDVNRVYDVDLFNQTIKFKEI